MNGASFGTISGCGSKGWKSETTVQTFEPQTSRTAGELSSLSIVAPMHILSE